MLSCYCYYNILYVYLFRITCIYIKHTLSKKLYVSKCYLYFNDGKLNKL